LRLPYLCFRVRLPGVPGKVGASQVLNVSLHPCRALRRPRQTLGALTLAHALCWLLRPLTHRRLPVYLDEAVSRLRGVRSPLRPGCCSVSASTRLFGHCTTPLCPCRQARRGALCSPPAAEVFLAAVTPLTGLSSSARVATLDRGGWFALTPRGLAPRQKRQASWRTTVRFSCGPASVTFAFHVSARRGRQLQPVLGPTQAPDPPNHERRP
jgi:hypothetical protein